MAIRTFIFSSNGDVTEKKLDIWYTIRGYEKPIGYKPEVENTGSFDIAWLLDGKKLVKPSNFKLTPEQVEYLRKINNYNTVVMNWLIAQERTSEILTEDIDGNVFCPVPCMSGDNPVNVLEKSGNYARIETVSIYKPIPENLPDYLCHIWRGFAGSKYYIPLGLYGGAKYPLFSKYDSTWVQLSGLVKRSA